jgi:hypothetical protein
MVKLELRRPTRDSEMVLVQNWFGELKRLMPAGRKSDRFSHSRLHPLLVIERFVKEEKIKFGEMRISRR